MGSNGISYTWNICPLRIPTNETCVAKARAASALIALGYIWFQTLNPHILFELVLYLVGGFDLLRDLSIIKSFDAKLVDTLESWPEDPIELQAQICLESMQSTSAVQASTSSIAAASLSTSAYEDPQEAERKQQEAEGANALGASSPYFSLCY
ncbi:hypothetical protein B0H34DRAFT_793393 [Crassisporium funariophilum]|nr:hypothetical protein B0H34DRAFT_793393 [Crassisporium funariophilum]